MPAKNKEAYYKEYYSKNKEKIKKLQKEYQARNRKALNEKRKLYYAENSESILRKANEWRAKNKEINKLSNSKSQKKYRGLHKEKLKKYAKERYENDLQFKLKAILRSRLRYALKGKPRDESAISLVGCSVSELIKHIEKQFTDGMSWSNYSFNGWHVDHIIPLCGFDLSDEEQCKKAFHFSNLQPLWAEDNHRKNGSKSAK